MFRNDTCVSGESDDGAARAHPDLHEIKQALSHREETLAKKRAQIHDVNHQIAYLRQSLCETEERKTKKMSEFKAVARHKVVAEGAQQRCNVSPVMGAADAMTTREEYITMLKEKERERCAVEEANDVLATSIVSMRKANGDAHKRLAVARLVSMLDNLRDTLNTKVLDEDTDEETDVQESFRILQELSRERERALSLLMQKERAILEGIALKKKRLRELIGESSENNSVQREANEYAVLSVAERIQRERNAMLDKIDEMRLVNVRLTEVLQNTKVTCECAVADREATLPLEDVVAPSSDVDDESQALRERIQIARAEQQRLDKRIGTLKEQIRSDTENYETKMNRIKKTIHVYQDECTSIEQANNQLKASCDSFAALLQNR